MFQNWTPAFTRRMICLCVLVSCTISYPILTADCQISEYVAFQTEDAQRLRYGPFTTDRKIDVSFRRWSVFWMTTSPIFYYLNRKL